MPPASLQLDQAVLLSAGARHSGQRDLLSRTAGVEDAIAKRLLQWTPAFWDLSEQQRESWQVFPVAAERLALCRSVYSHSEYGRAEGGRLLTLVVLVDRQQLEGFHHNIVLFTTLLRSEGGLTLPANLNEPLQQLTLPAGTLLTAADGVGTLDPNTVAKIARAIDIHKKVAIFGQVDPLCFCAALLEQFPPEQRWQTSFCTALKVSEHRPFQLHFYPAENPNLKKELVQAQVRTITLDPSEIPPRMARAW